MAYAIEQRPAEITPAFNPCVYVVSSSNYAQPNHQFIIDIKIGATLITRERFTPSPNNNNAFIDIKRVISNLVKFDLDFDLVQCFPMLNSQVTFTCEFGESYGTTTTLNIVSDTFTATNIGLDSYEWLNFDIANYTQKIINKGTTKLRIDSKAWLYFYHNNAAQVTGIRVTATNAAGTPTVSVINNPYNASNPVDRFIYCPMGANMNDILAANLTSGTAGNVLPADTVNVKMELLNSTTVLDTHTYSIINSCYGNYEAYYLNKNGGFETLVFNKKFKLSNDLKFQTAERLRASMLSATSFGYRSFDGQSINNSIITRQKWQLNTDWINDTESRQLFEMVSSPVIFLNDNGTIKRVNQNLAIYDEKLIDTTKMFNFSIDLMDSAIFERQWMN